MSSDCYFDDELDSGVLDQLDAIEAAHFTHEPPRPAHQVETRSKRPPPLQKQDSDFFDLTLDLDEFDLKGIDAAAQSYYDKPVSHAAAAGPSQQTRTGSKTKQQLDLFGNVVPTQPSSARPTSSAKSPIKRKPRVNPYVQKARQTKQWDHTAFAKSGWKKPKADKGKGKGKAIPGDQSDFEDEENIEFEQFPPPSVPIGPPPPMRLKPDLLEVKHWIYPLNQPKRDYQFNIARHCLYENTLVALPTGLGKTFLAGVVMLNFYRWFPQGKIVFVAPTKPLVAQQIEACHNTCGIPGRDAVELTGNNPRAYRAHMWDEKRIFYMTPQTLVNDLCSENCDPLNIILIVIDEAHKGTGDYAYAQVIRFLMAKNPHFRVLALTATPGSTTEAVQAIVDSLHISRIEIRDEQSIDLRGYMHKKEIKQHIIKMNVGVTKIMNLLAKIMEKIARSLASKGILEPVNVVRLHPYRITALRQQIGASHNPGKRWAFGPLSKLESMCRAMGYLMEASTGMCYNSLQELAKDKDDDSGKKNESKLRSDPEFQAVLREIESQRNQGFSLHPKMEVLKNLLVQHFGSRMVEDDQGGGGTRAMVFVTFRECVDEIVDILNEQMPLLKATRFVGQGIDKQGRKGFAQKEQLEVLEKFKAGEFNVLVSTSIGEEGLDIGEVDMIICYDAQKTPIRMLQRVGRTGRKRDGYVHVLLAEIREESNWDKAKDTYGELQKTIVRGDQLELYGDVERLLPENIKPELLEKVMEIDAYVKEDTARKKVLLGKGKKRKRNDDPGRNIPDGASTSFVTVADLVKKGAKKRKTTKKEFDPLAGEDDSTDMELESGLTLRRALTATAPTTSNPKSKAKLRKSSTVGGSRATKGTGTKKKRTAKALEPTHFSDKCADDSDDMDIQKETLLPPVPSSSRLTLSPVQTSHSQPSSPEIPLVKVDVAAKRKKYICSRQSSRKKVPLPIPSPAKPIKKINDGRKAKHRSPQLDAGLVASPKRSHSGSSPFRWSPSPITVPVIEDVIELTSSPSPPWSMSPLPDDSSHPQQQLSNKDGLLDDGAQPVPEPPIAPEVPLSPSLSEGDLNPEVDERNMAWLLDDDDEDLVMNFVDSSPPADKPAVPAPASYNYDESVEIVDGPSLVSPIRPTMDRSDQDRPEPSFAVRPVVKRPKRINRTIHSPEFSPADMPPPPRRLHRKTIESPLLQRATRNGKEVDRRNNPWVAMEAVHSGDEESEGSSHPEEDVESESDRQFIHDMSQSQVSSSYDQSLVYRQSLLTQAPRYVPNFANRPSRKGVLPAARENRPRRPILLSSSPARDEEPDEYAIGSFVVDDEAEVSFTVPSSDF